MVCPEEVQLPVALLKHVHSWEALGGGHEGLLHASRVDVAVADGSCEQCHRPRHHWGGYAGPTQRATAPVEGGASHPRAVGNNVRLHPAVALRQLLVCVCVCVGGGGG